MRASRGLLGAVVLSTACGGGGTAAFPGSADVAKAQAEWCAALAKVEGAEPGAWPKMAECKAARSSASAAYLRGMTKCFPTRVASLGADAPDHTQIATDCNDEIVVALPDDEAAGREVIDARCERMLRCEKVAVAECKAAVAKLESSQRVMFTVTYNAGALHAIADCLGSSSCSDDEEKARDTCYRPAAEKLVWLGG